MAAEDYLAGDSPPDEDEIWGYWEGMVYRVRKNVASGKKKGDGEPWALHIIEGVDGSQFSTFEIADAEFAEEMGGLPVLIDWAINHKDYKNITCIQAAVRPEAISDCGCPLPNCSCGGT